jgi:hypothetical protein
MKRILNIVFAAITILLFPFSVVMGQDKKSEEKIKIIADDGSGTKVILDTIFYNSPKPDSIKLKDGTVIYMKHSVDDRNFKHHQGKNQVMVTTSSDKKADGKEFKEVTVVSSDSLQSKMADDSNNVMYYSNSGSHEGRGGRKYKVMTRKYDGQSEKEEIIYVNKGRNPDKEIENTFDVFVSNNEGDSTIEKSRYVIAKDGIVVTIEGNDDARAKELVKVIESKLGLKSDGTEEKETVKVESKKPIKK